LAALDEASFAFEVGLCCWLEGGFGRDDDALCGSEAGASEEEAPSLRRAKCRASALPLYRLVTHQLSIRIGYAEFRDVPGMITV
jgi:hypothetical protein